MSLRLLFAAFALALGLVAPAAAEGWRLPPPGYSYAAAAPCLENAERAARPIRPGAAVYRVCEDQVAFLARSIEEARAEGKLLIVTVGATWCPWCAALQRLMPGEEFFARKGDAIDYAATFRHIEIGVSTTHKGRNLLIPSGDAALDALLARSGGVKIEAIPFLVVLDPQQPDRIFARNLKDISDFAKGEQDMAGFRRVIAEAHASLTHSRAAVGR